MYTITHNTSGRVYVGSTKDIRRRLREHAKKLPVRVGEAVFQGIFTVKVWYSHCDVETAGTLERRLTRQLSARGVRLLNSPNVCGPPRGKVLHFMIKCARAKKLRNL